MRKLFFLSTGGTIASVSTKYGLIPALTPQDLLKITGLDNNTFDFLQLLSIDSSNINASHWRVIANTINEKLPYYDGIVMTHGTDTMAYTSSILSFIFQNLEKPVIITGSQLPLHAKNSDAPKNLKDSIDVCMTGIYGIYMVFNGKVIKGCRASKIKTDSIDAFESINELEAGNIKNSGIKFNKYKNVSDGEYKYDCKFDEKVMLLKIFPGMNPKLIGNTLELGYNGLVIEAYGMGGVPCINSDILTEINKLTNNSIPVVVVSQCPFGRVNLGLYEVGRLLLQTGVIPTYNMTTEAAYTKLMFALGHTKDMNEIKRFMTKNISGEIELLD